jgi:hypothetical protein
LLVRSPAPKPLSNLVVTANKHIEMLFAHLKRILRLGRCGYAGHEVLSLSLCWQRSRKIFAVVKSS